MQKLAVYIVFYLLASQSAAQSFTVFNYSVDQGLPSAEVYEVFQDKEGFIWFATDNGVVRFDGQDMTVFRQQDGLEDPVVFGIHEDHHGRVWFRTFSGKLFYYENKKIIPYQYNEILTKTTSTALFISIYIDRKDELWFSAPGFIGHINSKGELHADSVGFVNNTLVFKTVVDGFILVSGYSKATQISIDGKVFPIERNTNKHEHIERFCVRWKNKLYLTADNCIFEYNGVTLKKVHIGNSAILGLYRDPDDNLWVCYREMGVQRFDNPAFRKPFVPDCLKEKSVTSIIKDTEGGLWATTLENGVFYIPDMAIERYPYPDSSKVKTVTSSGENIFLGSYNGALTVLDASTMKSSVVRRYGASIDGLFADSDKNIWVSAHGTTILDQNLQERRRLWLTAFLDFAEDRHGNIWAMAGTGIAKYSEQGELLLNKTAKSRLRNMLFEDSIIYAAHRLGFGVYDTMMNLLHTPAALSRFKISKILSLNDKTLLISTMGNGFLLANKRNWICHQFSSQSQFIADNIYAAMIIEDDLWLGTEKGIVVCSVNSLLHGDPDCYRLTKKSGLVSDKINFMAKTENQMWVFSDEGYSIIPTNLPMTNEAQVPDFYFKKLSVNNKPIALDQEINLGHNATNLQIAFGYLSLKNQDIISRYRLTKNDPWIYTRDRVLQFPSLAPSEYVLEIEHSIDNFHWTQASSALEFVVTPPWWQQWYNQLVALLIFGSLIYLYFVNRSRRIHKQQQRLMQAEIETLERERNRIAKELHDGVATNLSAIKLMVNHLLKSHHEPMAGELDEHFLHTIKEIKGIIYGLTPPGLERDGLFTGLRNYIEKLNQTIPIKIHLDILGKEIREPELGLLSFRIIQELLSNAVKHSFAKNISIKINSKDDQLSLVFKDDGIGFSYDPAKSGLGLANVESRVESVNGNFAFESGSSGTSYIISIPLN